MIHKMIHKKSKKELVDATTASVKKEMAMPRMARSARVAELKLDTARTPEKPSISMPGIVDKIILSSSSSKAEEAQVAVDGPQRGYRTLRIENALTDEHGIDVKLKKGSHVEVTVTEDPKT
jgi:hypothetical protein